MKCLRWVLHAGHTKYLPADDLSGGGYQQLPGGKHVLKHIQSSKSWNDKNLAAKGFTLIELLVVIVILGVLGAVVVFSVRCVTNDSKTNACKTEKRTLNTAIEAYYAKFGGDPASLAILESAGLIKDQNTLGYTVTAGAVSGTCPNP